MEVLKEIVGGGMLFIAIVFLIAGATQMAFAIMDLFDGLSHRVLIPPAVLILVAGLLTGISVALIGLPK